jgi:hypothetical protein
MINPCNMITFTDDNNNRMTMQFYVVQRYGLVARPGELGARGTGTCRFLMGLAHC